MKRICALALVMSGITAGCQTDGSSSRLSLPVLPSPQQVFGPNFTADQQASLDRALASPIRDPQIVAARQQADPVIRHMATTLGCTSKVTNGPVGDLERYKAPGGVLNNFPPMAMMAHHPKSQCLTVTRADAWAMPALNALSLRVLFASDASGETSERRAILERQPDGLWMIKQLL